MPRWSLTFAFLAAAVAASGLPAPQAAPAPPWLPRGAVGQDGCLEIRAWSSGAPAGGRLEVHAAEDCAAPTDALDVVLVLDASGSMAADGKLDAARAAARELAGRLGPDDHLGLVVFADDAEVLLPLGRPGARFDALLDTLAPTGSTALEAGIRAAEAMGGRDVPRHLVVLTDGRDNRGPAAAARVAEGGTGATISTVGLGLDYDEAALRQVARARGGAFHATATGTELPELLAAAVGDGRRGGLRDVQVTLTGGFQWGLGSLPAGETVVLPLPGAVEGASTWEVRATSATGEALAASAPAEGS